MTVKTHSVLSVAVPEVGEMERAVVVACVGHARVISPPNPDRSNALTMPVRFMTNLLVPSGTAARLTIESSIESRRVIDLS